MENLNNKETNPNQYESGVKYAGYTLIGIVGLIVILSLITGCGVSKESQKCCQQETIELTPPHDPLND